MTMTESWQTSWDDFVDLLIGHIQSDDQLNAFVSHIAGKKVNWTGLFEKADLDELAPNVYIGLPAKQIDFLDGRTATMDGISLPIASGSRAAWANAIPGQTICFEATLVGGGSPVPLVWVKTFTSGRTIIMIRLRDGRLLE